MAKIMPMVARKPFVLVVENTDIGPLYFIIEETRGFPENWVRMAEGVAMPGSTRVPVDFTNSQGFFRVGWKKA